MLFLVCNINFFCVLMGPKSPFQLPTLRGLKSRDISFWKKCVSNCGKSGSQSFPKNCFKMLAGEQKSCLRNILLRTDIHWSNWSFFSLVKVFFFLFLHCQNLFVLLNDVWWTKNSATNQTSQGMELWHQEAVASQIEKNNMDITHTGQIAQVFFFFSHFSVFIQWIPFSSQKETKHE